MRGWKALWVEEVCHLFCIAVWPNKLCHRFMPFVLFIHLVHIGGADGDFSVRSFQLPRVIIYIESLWWAECSSRGRGGGAQIARQCLPSPSQQHTSCCPHIITKREGVKKKNGKKAVRLTAWVDPPPPPPKRSGKCKKFSTSCHIWGYFAIL